MFKRQNSAIKIWQLIGGGPLATGAPSHGTTGTVDNPALNSSLLETNTVQKLRERRMHLEQGIPKNPRVSLANF